MAMLGGVTRSSGRWIMQLDLDLIFPMREASSAELMTLKAACLSRAGIINARQKKIVEQRAQMFLRTDSVLSAPPAFGGACSFQVPSAASPVPLGAPLNATQP
jgi:hypothetical protein